MPLQKVVWVSVGTFIVEIVVVLFMLWTGLLMEWVTERSIRSTEGFYFILSLMSYAVGIGGLIAASIIVAYYWDDKA